MLDGVRAEDVTSMRWRVASALPAFKLSGAALLIAGGVLLAGGDPVGIGVGLLAAIALGGWAVRDLTAPVRLCADAHGLMVATGYHGWRRLAWSEVDQIRVDVRPHLGLRTETLEIDAGESLFLLGRYALGAPPSEVADALQAFKARSA
jgi:hypothetical protein